MDGRHLAMSRSQSLTLLVFQQYALHPFEKCRFMLLTILLLLRNINSISYLLEMALELLLVSQKVQLEYV
jgi:hypothetical protein